MITLVLHVLRLLPVLCGGHRPLALENLVLRQQLASDEGIVRPSALAVLSSMLSSN
jgi:hypothetical protein